MLDARRIHRKSVDAPGQAHALTFSCFGRQPLLAGQHAPAWLAESIAHARQAGLFDLWAFVFMPEHVHLVILPAPEVTIRTILSRIKQPVTRRCLAWVDKHAPEFLSRMADVQPNGKLTHRFWQRGGGYDRNLRSLADVHEKIHYIHANPVRRGLVQRPEDWLWSSARNWSDGTDAPLPLDKDSLPPLMKNQTRWVT